MKFIKYIGLILFLAHPVCVQAREEKYLDDKPQDVYNPTTTLFTTQSNIQHNLGGYTPIADDMSIYRMHRFTFVQQHGNKLQNLGSNGTALKPIFYTLPEHIGANSGFYAYNLYFRNPQKFRYYDTKSPYTNIYATLAHFFYTVTDHFVDVCHSRNVTPNWNIGFNFRSILTDKAWLPAKQHGNSNVITHGIDLFTNYKTDSERYQLLAHLSLMKHRVRETGGLYTEAYEETEREPMLFKGPVESRLQTAENSELRKYFHLYHQLAAGTILKTYHELSIQDKRHIFSAHPWDINNIDPQSMAASFRKEDISEEATETMITEWSAQNELGLKGDWQGLFYSGYYRYKKLAFRHKKPLQDKCDFHEHYVGLHTRYHLANNVDFLNLSGEYLLQGAHKICLGYQGHIFNLTAERVSYRPSFLAQRYNSHHRQWANQFTRPTATQLRGRLRLESSMVQLRLHTNFTRVSKPIYFQHISEDKKLQRQTMVAEPRQDLGYANIVTWGTELDTALGPHIHWDSELTVAHVLGPSANIFHVPRFLINSRLYYTASTATGNGIVEAGMDVHWKSSYKADAYDPVTQQFYLQNSFNIYSYPVLDLFVNFKIKHWSMFFKFSHWNEGLFAKGYFVTPFYPGQKRTFDVGINWSFFD